MSAILKCLLGLFAVLCFMQFVEMARFRREDAKDAKDPGVELTNAVSDLVTKLRGALDDDTMKKIMEAATNAFSEGSKVVQEHLSEISSKIGVGAPNAGGNH